MTGSHLHLDHLRLRQLRLLDLIDRHGSLRSVAGEINLTQPAVSQMLKDLERAFGVTLVRRSARGVALTRAGRIALDRANAGLSMFENLAADLAADLPPVLRIGANPVILLGMLPAALRELGVAQSDIQFHLHAGTVGAMMDMLWAGALDCYVGHVDGTDITDVRAANLVLQPLSKTDFIIACSAQHPLAARERVSAAELLEWPWALQPRNSNIRTMIESAFRDCGAGVPIPAVEASGEPTALAMLARQTDLLICIPRIGLDALIDTGAVRILALSDLVLPPVQTHLVTHRENDDLPPLRRLREALLTVANP